jgi:hypothetical protein
VLQLVSTKSHFFTFAEQEDNPVISSRSPTPDVIEAIPIKTQAPTNTDEDHRSRPPTPGPIQTQVHAETGEPRRSYPPTPDTITNVDEQQEGIRSNSSRFTNSFSICQKHNHFLPFFVTIDAFTNLYALFSPPFLYMEPPAPEALRGSVQNVESICNLPQTSSIIDELPGQVPCCVFCISFFLLASQHFVLTFLYL